MKYILAILIACSTGCITQNQKDTIETAWGKLPAIPTPEPARVYDHGRLLYFHTPDGKRVEMYADGILEGGWWEAEAQKAWEGIVCEYKKAYPDSSIDEVEIDGTETRINSYIESQTVNGTWYEPVGIYVDNGQPAEIPDNVQYFIRTKWKDSNKRSPYYIEFSYGNMADCIDSLNGLYVISGDEGHVNVPAQKSYGHTCSGVRTYLR